MKATIDGNVVKIEPGFTVLCDFCGVDFTTSTVEGGLLFESKAVCPVCAPRVEYSAKKYGEERFIRGRCPEGTSFADWVRGELR